jgi:hypothetical protein
MLNVVHTEIISEYKNRGYLPMKERRADELSCISLQIVDVNVTMNVERIRFKRLTENDEQ